MALRCVEVEGRGGAGADGVEGSECALHLLGDLQAQGAVDFAGNIGFEQVPSGRHILRSA